MPVLVKVQSPRVTYTPEAITSRYTYESSTVRTEANGQVTIQPYSVELNVTTSARIPRTGLMIVGLGGNNGTTLAGTLIANRHKLTWHTKTGVEKANFLGSVSQVGTVPVGLDQNGQEVFVPIKNMIPLIDPLDLEIDGWDISSMDLGEGMKRAGVFEWELQEKLRPHMRELKPRRAVFFQDFVAANQADRADNILEGTKWEQLEQLRADVRDFKSKKNLDKILILWVGNTERFVELADGLNDNWTNLEKSIKANAFEISPSTLYAVAAVLENCAYINGSPQNTLVPGVLDLAAQRGVSVAGDDLKTGQTKLKSVLVDYLVGAGLRPLSIVSYNHLGNNDGKNLSAPHTFRSKEITKAGVVEDLVASNTELFPAGSKPDHLIVIKYVPAVGDSKRAMDEYVSAIGMGGLNTLVIHNTCEDSLLAAPIMLDLVIFMELFQRMKVVSEGQNVTLDMGTMLGYWLKAPLTSMTNSLFRQRAAIENLIRAALSLPASTQLHLDVGNGHHAQKTQAPVKGVPLVNGIHGANGSAYQNDVHVNGSTA